MARAYADTTPNLLENKGELNPVRIPVLRLTVRSISVGYAHNSAHHGVLSTGVNTMEPLHAYPITGFARAGMGRLSIMALTNKGV